MRSGQVSLVRIDCPHCSTSNALPRQAVGKMARCCKCGQNFPVKVESVSTVLVAEPVTESTPLPHAMNDPDGGLAELSEAIAGVSRAAPGRAAPAPVDDPFSALQTGMSRGENREKKNLARLRLEDRRRRKQRNILLVGVCIVAALILLLVLARSHIQSAMEGDAGPKEGDVVWKYGNNK